MTRLNVVAWLAFMVRPVLPSRILAEHSSQLGTGQLLRERYRLQKPLRGDGPEGLRELLSRDGAPEHPGVRGRGLWKPPTAGLETPVERKRGIFPYENHSRSILSKDRYQRPQFVGKGGFGDTWQAWDELERRHVAIKIAYHGRRYITKGLVEEKSFLKQTLEDSARECRVSQKMMSAWTPYPEGKEHLCNCLACHVDDMQSVNDVAFIVMEMCGTSLEQLMAEQWARDETASLDERYRLRVQRAMKGALMGIKFMASLSPPMQHMDIKPDNVVVKDGRAKLIDFGQSVAYFKPQEVVAWGRAPPEHVTRRGPVSVYPLEKSWAYDVWTWGGMYYELLCRKGEWDCEFGSATAATSVWDGKGYVDACRDGSRGRGSKEDWDVIKHALTLFENRSSPDALLQLLP